MFLEINTSTANITVPNADIKLIKDIETSIKAWETRTYHGAVPAFTKLPCPGRNGMMSTAMMAMSHLMLIRKNIDRMPKQEFLGNGKERETGVQEFGSPGVQE